MFPAMTLLPWQIDMPRRPLVVLPVIMQFEKRPVEPACMLTPVGAVEIWHDSKVAKLVAASAWTFAVVACEMLQRVITVEAFGPCR